MRRTAFTLAFPFILTACAGFELQKESLPRLPSSAPAPFAAHFAQECLSGFSPTLGREQVEVLTGHMGGRDHRIWHNFWHATRNSWHILTPEQQDFFLRLDSRWQPPRLLGAPAGAVASAQFDPRKNNAGEDFFYMHHSMMGELYGAFGAAGVACPEPWISLPKKDDQTWPIQRSRDGKDEKSDTAFVQMEAWRRQFQDPKYLKGKTLGDVGYLVETTLHNNMHMRWSTYDPPAGFGDRPDITPETLAHGLEEFDRPGYNWLADSYSAHVNPIFWKLHGLVENVMFAWLEANGYSEIGDDCSNRSGCYQWKGTWIGARPGLMKGPMPGGPDSHGGSDGFSAEFQKAYDDFIEGKAGGKDFPHGPDRALPPPSSSERERRRKLLTDAFHILQKNSAMDRGGLRGSRLERVKRGGAVSPEEYVKWVDAEE